MKRPLFSVLGLAVALLVGATLLVGPAQARTEHTLRYSKTQSFNSALRYLRVDRGYNVVEKDPDSGYLMFEYKSDGSEKTTNGSIEVIERGDEIALVVQLPQLPEYHERLIANGLLKKLSTDYGAPPALKKPSPKKPPSPAKPDQSGPPKEKAPEAKPK